MSQQTMTEKDQFLNAFEREYQTTLKTLKNYPPDKIDLKPAPHMNTAKQIAWMLVLNQIILEPTLNAPALSDAGLPEPPKSMAELIIMFERAHADVVTKLKASNDGQWNTTVKIPVGPKQIGDVRRGEALWMFLMDTIHHRGQFSVYVRLAGGKLASIYGPTADEPWN
jgi:uncharacterized damage-inducible protein DinB